MVWWVPVKRNTSNSVLIEDWLFTVERWSFEPYRHVLIFLKLQRMSIMDLPCIKLFMFRDHQNYFRSCDEIITLQVIRQEGADGIYAVQIEFEGLHTWRCFMNILNHRAEMIENSWIDVTREGYHKLDAKPPTAWMVHWAKDIIRNAELIRIQAFHEDRQRIFCRYQGMYFYIARRPAWEIIGEPTDLVIEDIPGLSDRRFVFRLKTPAFSVDWDGVKLFKPTEQAIQESSLLIDAKGRVIEPALLSTAQ